MSAFNDWNTVKYRNINNTIPILTILYNNYIVGSN